MKNTNSRIFPYFEGKKFPILREKSPCMGFIQNNMPLLVFN
jgi:hypothetical protein